MKKSQSVKSSSNNKLSNLKNNPSVNDAKKTKSFLDVIKKHKGDIKNSMLNLQEQNEEFVRSQYNYMDKLFAQSKADLIENQQSFQLSSQNPSLSKTKYETFEDITSERKQIKSESFLNDESSEDEPEYHAKHYPDTQSFYNLSKKGVVSTPEINKVSKAVSFKENKKRVGEQTAQSSRCNVEPFDREPSKSILKQPSTHFEIRKDSRVSIQSDETNFLRAHLSRFLAIDTHSSNYNSIFKRARNALDLSAIKSLF